MKALALSSRPVFVVCDKEKYESCLEKKNSVHNAGDLGIIIEMERFFQVWFQPVSTLKKNSSSFFPRKLSH